MLVPNFSKKSARAFLSRKHFNAALRATQSGKTYKVPCISHWYTGTTPSGDDLPDTLYKDTLYITVSANGNPLAPWCYVEDGWLHVPSVFVA